MLAVKISVPLLALTLSAVLLAGPVLALSSPAEEWPELSAPGKKNWIDDQAYIIYKFTAPPQMGTVILRVQAFSKSGKKDTSYIVQAEYGMPSMSGAHDSGEQKLVLNKAGNYLLPLNIVMPGEWELKLTVFKNGPAIYRGRTKFDV
jgi:hypothetical protein